MNILSSELIGLTINTVKRVNKGISINGGQVVLSAYGDCCSIGWVELRSAPKLPAKITGRYTETGTETVEEGEPRFPKGGDVVRVWCAEFPTENGPLVVEVWNDSNGWYGSTLEINRKDAP
jgi:hypothetical protein